MASNKGQTPQALFGQMITSALLKGWPNHYQSDLFYDAVELYAKSDKRDDGQRILTKRFLWVLRECGSHFVWLDGAYQATLDAMLNESDGRLAYYFDGYTLAPIPTEDALKLDRSSDV